MFSSAVSSVLYLREVAGEHTEHRQGSYDDGDATSVHDSEFCIRL